MTKPRKTKKLVCGVGYRGNLPTKDENGNTLKSYLVWKAMLCRCYSEKTHIHQPTYKDCTVAEEWHSYANFLAFFNEHYVEGYELDKDLLRPGNKEYGPETARFVPRWLNNYFKNADRKKIVSVYCVNDRYYSQIRIGSKLVVLTSSEDPILPHCAFAIAKYRVLKALFKKDKTFTDADVRYACIDRSYSQACETAYKVETKYGESIFSTFVENIHSKVDSKIKLLINKETEDEL